MSQITINDLTFSYDSVYDNIFEHVSFQIDTDWKLGFIGRNGKGKTTFLNLLQRKYEYRGSITASVSFDYFPFETKDESINTMKLIKNTIAPFSVWEAEMQKCIEEQEGGGAETEENLKEDIRNQKQRREDLMERYGQLLDLYQTHDGYIIEELIEKELGKLSVDLSVLQRPFSTLSFGERTKIMLAALFLKKNNFLLIDEPTNHLDLEGRETLAGYLQSKKGFLLVSHDRAFLDQCIDHVLSINRSDIEVVKGNFTTWQQNKELKDHYELQKKEQLLKDIVVLEEAARRAKGWSDQVEASKIGMHAPDRGAIGHKAAKMMKRAKVIENRKLDAIEEKKGLLKNFEEVEALKINILPFPNKVMAEAEQLSLFYDHREIVSKLSFTLKAGERLALKGANGSGKSSLIKLLLGERIEFSGSFRVAQGLTISYVSQDTSWLKGDLREFAGRYGVDETIFKTVLRQLDFSRKQFEKDIRDFSGGQKKKVLLAKSLAEPANLFIWDEPLNYVDVFSRMQIEDLLLKYQPTMIFVEHDRIFSERIATKILELPVGVKF